MTCQDCVHYEACCGWASKRYVEDSFDDCPHFKPKSRFVELPCEVGQTVYRVSFLHKNVTPLKVEGFLRNLASWKVHCTHLIPSWVGNQKEHIYIAFSSFGKTVFLSREEAESALKERESK